MVGGGVAVAVGAVAVVAVVVAVGVAVAAVVAVADVVVVAVGVEFVVVVAVGVVRLTLTTRRSKMMKSDAQLREEIIRDLPETTDLERMVQWLKSEALVAHPPQQGVIEKAADAITTLQAREEKLEGYIRRLGENAALATESYADIIAALRARLSKLEEELKTAALDLHEAAGRFVAIKEVDPHD